MNNYFGQSFTALNAVFFDGAFSAKALNLVLDENLKKEDKALITNIFYGVLENNEKLEETVNGYLTTKVKPKIKLVLKIGLYIILYLDKIPLYAACDNAVNYSKKLNAGNYTSLVNAVLRKMTVLRGDKKEQSALLPEWFDKKLSNYYQSDVIDKIRSVQSKRTHVRLNDLFISDIVFKSKMNKSGVGYMPSEQGGYFVDDVSSVKDLYDGGMVTFQSPSSILTCKAFGENLSGKLLDCCAAPGGKTIYLASKNKDLIVTACDVYPHRVQLINSYASRMKVTGINVLLCDATVNNPLFNGAFDYVLCDAPCSGTGTIKRRPDVFLNKTENDVVSLNILQNKIIQNVFNYLRHGGYMVYSTCSLLDDENDLVLEKFISNNKAISVDLTLRINKENYVNKKYGKQILPVNGYDGFYISLIKKV